MARGDLRSLAPRTLAVAWRAAKGQQGGWAKSIGPARRAMLSLRRIGWSMPGPCCVEDESGRKMKLQEVLPALMKQLLHQGVQRQLAKEHGGKVVV